jgi:hypothetical protein
MTATETKMIQLDQISKISCFFKNRHVSFATMIDAIVVKRHVIKWLSSLSATNNLYNTKVLNAYKMHTIMETG